MMHQVCDTSDRCDTVSHSPSCVCARMSGRASQGYMQIASQPSHVSQAAAFASGLSPAAP